MLLYLRDSRKQQFTIEIPEGSLVIDAKNTIAKEKNVSVSGIRLIFNSKILNDQDSLDNIHTDQDKCIVCYLPKPTTVTSPQQETSPQQAVPMAQPAPMQPGMPSPFSPNPIQPPPSPSSTNDLPNTEMTKAAESAIEEEMKSIKSMTPEQAKENLLSMGFTTDQVERAMTLGGNDFLIAQELLLSGDLSDSNASKIIGDYRREAYNQTYQIVILANIGKSPDLMQKVNQGLPINMHINGTLTQIAPRPEDIQKALEIEKEYNKRGIQLPKILMTSQEYYSGMQPGYMGMQPGYMGLPAGPQGMQPSYTNYPNQYQGIQAPFQGIPGGYQNTYQQPQGLYPGLTPNYNSPQPTYPGMQPGYSNMPSSPYGMQQGYPGAYSGIQQNYGQQQMDQSQLAFQQIFSQFNQTEQLQIQQLAQEGHDILTVVQCYIACDKNVASTRELLASMQ